jgi:AcrR family transcriptional regulator
MSPPRSRSAAPAARTRRRLAPEERRSQILDAAGALVVERGVLPIAVDAVAARIEASKALVYSYFPTQHDLLNAVLVRALREVATPALLAAAQTLSDEALAAACADAYFAHVAERGPLLHILLGDRFLAGRLAPEAVALRNRLMGRLARRMRAAFGLDPADAVGALNLALVFAEATGEQVFKGRLDRDLARSICLEMTAGAMASLAERRRQPPRRRDLRSVG